VSRERAGRGQEAAAREPAQGQEVAEQGPAPAQGPPGRDAERERRAPEEAGREDAPAQGA
jgi:hypothetical protein